MLLRTSFLASEAISDSIVRLLTPGVSPEVHQGCRRRSAVRPTLGSAPEGVRGETARNDISNKYFRIDTKDNY
jgi:hypothetical protein